MVIYHKVNGQLLDPSTGQRLRKGQKPLARSGKQLSFSAVALTAFIGFRVCQLLHRCFRKTQLPEEQLLLQQQVDDQQVLPAVVSAWIALVNSSKHMTVIQWLMSS
jgi:hypothetical protein